MMLWTRIDKLLEQFSADERRHDLAGSFDRKMLKRAATAPHLFFGSYEGALGTGTPPFA